jgi:hypothetical protein
MTKKKEFRGKYQFQVSSCFASFFFFPAVTNKEHSKLTNFSSCQHHQLKLLWHCLKEHVGPPIAHGVRAVFHHFHFRWFWATTANERGTPRTKKTPGSAFLEFSVADCQSRSQNKKYELLKVLGSAKRKRNWMLGVCRHVRVYTYIYVTYIDIYIHVRVDVMIHASVCISMMHDAACAGCYVCVLCVVRTCIYILDIRYTLRAAVNGFI